MKSAFSSVTGAALWRSSAALCVRPAANELKTIHGRQGDRPSHDLTIASHFYLLFDGGAKTARNARSAAG